LENDVISDLAAVRAQDQVPHARGQGGPDRELSRPPEGGPAGRAALGGTHLGAPYHFHPTMKRAERAITIDEVVQWCF